MDHYLEITIHQDLEFTDNQILTALYAKLHRALPQNTNGRVGVSFPKYKKTGLGNQVRLHGSVSDLHLLQSSNWMQGIRDHITIQDITPIPANVAYRTVRRVQTKSAHKKRKRSIAKGWLTQEEAQLRIPDSQQHILTQPFIELLSLSNRNRMKVFIEHGPLVTTSTQGHFNSYGLSATSTIPWF